MGLDEEGHLYLYMHLSVYTIIYIICRSAAVAGGGVGKSAVLYQLCHFSFKRLEETWDNWYSTALFLHKTATIWG